MPKKARIDDACLERHADTLSQVILTMGLTDTETFWSVLRKRWAVPELESALLAFTSIGSVEAFQALFAPSSKKPVGYWRRWEHAEQRLKEIRVELGYFPKATDLTELGEYGLRKAIMSHHGGFPAVRERMGESLLRERPGHWKDWETVEAAIKEMITELGRFPVHADFDRPGRRGLIGCIRIYYGGLMAVCTRMGYETTRVPDHHWDVWENTEPVLRSLIEKLGHFPLDDEFSTEGYSSLGVAIRRTHGGISVVRERMGFKPLRRRNQSSWKHWENLEPALRQLIAEHGGIFPTTGQLTALGHGGILNAIATYHGGREEVYKRLGYEAPRAPEAGVGEEPSVVPPNPWLDWERAAAKILAIREELGRWPKHRDLRALGLDDLESAITRVHGGWPEVHRRLKTSRNRKRGYWQEWSNVERELREVMTQLGAFPKQAQLVELKRSSLSIAISKHHGGFAEVRRRMGIQPVSDAMIEAHAEPLARLIPTLGLTDTEPFWNRLKERWVERDLKAAVEDYERDGTVERFRVLLDG